MKNLLTFFVFFFALSVEAATVEAFFTKLEGSWEKVSADSYRETLEGEIFHSVGTHFKAVVKRTGNRWDFAEEMCWKEEGLDEVCSETSAAYEIEGDRLFTIVNEEKLPVDIIEIDSDYLLMSLYTSGFSFTAVLTLEGKILSQNGVVEMNDGTKEYQLLKLMKK